MIHLIDTLILRNFDAFLSTLCELSCRAVSCHMSCAVIFFYGIYSGLLFYFINLHIYLSIKLFIIIAPT